MARIARTLPAVSRMTDHISLGAVATTVPIGTVHAVLAATNRTSIRRRDLPADTMMYFAVAMALYMQCSLKEVFRCLVDGIQFLFNGLEAMTVPSDSAISQARSRLGWEPIRELHDQIVRPIAVTATRGARYRRWLVVSMDGSTLDVQDEPANADAFGRPASRRGRSAFPQIRFVSLVESGTHVLFGTRMGPCTTSELALAREVLPCLKLGMLCLTDRNFFNYKFWNEARATGADLLWRVKKNARLPCEQRLADGSYLSTTYPTERDRRHKTNGIVLRLIDYALDGVVGADPLYRLVTTILDPELAPARELAALYHERWEVESTLDEVKTHLRGIKMILRSKTPNLVRQEFYSLIMAHFVTRALMHEAALKADIDPDRLSFVHTVRVIRRKISQAAAIFPSANARLAQCRSRRNPTGAFAASPTPAQQAWCQTKNEQLSNPSCHRQAFAISQYREDNQNCNT